MLHDNRLWNYETLSTDAGAAGRTKHIPYKRERRQGKALCLSGGGYRAALFHLGALRRLNELGILSQLDTITSASGGSIMSAILADRMRPWPEAGHEFADWETKVAMPLREFITHDIRTRPIIAGYFPWNWFRTSTQAKELARCYYRQLTKQRVQELPSRPRFVFCATDVVFGANWVCERESMGDCWYGHTEPPKSFLVAEAVAASSCCPPMFGPLLAPCRPCDYKDGKSCGPTEYSRYRRAVMLTDAGVYDNMATEPVWKDHAIILVSDAGAPFRFATNTWSPRLLWRYQDLFRRQSAALRRRWLISNFIEGVLSGTYWGIGTDVADYPTHEPRHYPPRLVTGTIARVRTDLASMSKAEIAVLENQGYLTADAAIRSHVPQLIPNAFKTRSVALPYPDYIAEDLVRRELRDSHRFWLFGRHG